MTDDQGRPDRPPRKSTRKAAPRRTPAQKTNGATRRGSVPATDFAADPAAANGAGAPNGSAASAPSAAEAAAAKAAKAAEAAKAAAAAAARSNGHKPRPLPPAVADKPGDVWDDRVAKGLSFLRRRLAGDYEVDEFGFDPELTDQVFLPMLRLLYRDWFRTEVFGVENLPANGPALVVGNHSGTVALDAIMLATALNDRTPNRRHLRLLGADLVFRMPIVSELARKSGGTVACNPDAERLLRNGELVGVFPEGFKGVGKQYAQRYKLQRFGRGGFVSAALRTGTPIVPAAIVGAEEIYPMLADIKPLARLLGLPYFPVTPTFPWLGPLGMLPLPSKWLIEFSKPIPTAHLTDQADDPLVVFNLADQVRETIQQTLHTLLERRPDPFGR